MIKGDAVDLKRRIMKSLFFALLLVLAASVYAGAAEEKAVARVNGELLTERQLEIAIDELMPRSYFHGGVSPEKRMELRPKALEGLIRKELFLQEARKTGYVISKTELEDAVRKVEQRFKSKDEYQQALKSSGLTEKTYESIVERNLLFSKFETREITEKSRVSDAELAAYYEKNKAEYLKPESFRVRHIFIRVDPASSQEERLRLKQEAEGILEKARKGEDFADLAYRYSQDDWRVKGGDLGLVHRGRLDPLLEAAGFGLEKGQVSGVVETLHGYHILKLEDKFPATQLGYDEVKDKLRTQLESKRRKDLEDGLMKRLRESSKIEIY